MLSIIDAIRAWPAPKWVARCHATLESEDKPHDECLSAAFDHQEQAVAWAITHWTKFDEHYVSVRVQRTGEVLPQEVVERGRK